MGEHTLYCTYYTILTTLFSSESMTSLSMGTTERLYCTYYTILTTLFSSESMTSLSMGTTERLYCTYYTILTTLFSSESMTSLSMGTTERERRGRRQRSSRASCRERDCGISRVGLRNIASGIAEYRE